MRYLMILTLLLLSSLKTQSQSYVGHAVDNYSGIHSVIFNPANVVESPLKADINLLSISTFSGTDYFNINFDQITNEDFEFENDVETFPTNNNNFFGNVDVVGPSFMFNLSKKSSIGFISRARAFYQINGINGTLFESLANDFDDNENFQFDSSNLTTNVHAWAEFGLTYGRVLFSSQKHLLTGGVTFKYLLGVGSGFASTPNFSGEYFADREVVESQGTITYGNTPNFDGDDINFENLSTGYGFDVGFVYEYHPKRLDDNIRYYQDPYRLKLAVSVTDIGSIDYENTEFTTYDLNTTVSTNQNTDDIQDFLDANFPSTTETGTASIQLPTALHLLLDYRIAGKLLVSAQANLAMSNDADQLSGRIINTIVLAPRLETKWFSLYAPISFREYDEVAYGAGLRLGPLSIGSGSILSNILTDESRTTDVFVGLKIPIYRK